MQPPSDIQSTVQEILDQFAKANQEVYSKLEQLGLTLQAVEITMVPIEQTTRVVIRTFDKVHHHGYPLKMQKIDFDEHLKANLPPSTLMRMANTHELTASDINRLTENYDDVT